MPSVRYTTAGQAIAGADGTARVVFRGPAQWESIDVDAISLHVSGSSTLPEARLYSSATPQAHRLLASDLNGSSGSFRRTGSSDVIGPSDAWCVEWTGATPGAVCTATLTGTHTRP